LQHCRSTTPFNPKKQRFQRLKLALEKREKEERQRKDNQKAYLNKTLKIEKLLGEERLIFLRF
jgi:hypothetical protein